MAKPDAAETALREAIIAKCLWMNAAGLNQGVSGNIAARFGDRMLITPSGIAYEAMTPEMIASLPLDGDPEAWEGPCAPSSEWRFHWDLLRARPEFGAVVHTHATCCTALAIARKPIPAVHYMIALFGGDDIRCADYARFGSQALSDNALRAMEGRAGCLLANHGMLAAGADLERAMWLASELETLAKQYCQALAIGGATVLSRAEIDETLAAFRARGYGL